MTNQKIDLFKIENNFAKTAQIQSNPIFEAKISFVPKITIAIPTYKRADLLKIAVDSAINQLDFIEYDIIVVDNNPERGCVTEQLMLSYQNNRISYYKNIENLGMFGNWNRCIELAKGEYFTNLNDDDSLDNDYLKSVSNVISNDSEIDAVLVDFHLIDFDGKRILEKINTKTTTNKIIPLDLLFGNINPGSLGILFLRNSLLTIGGYNDAHYPSSDYMFLLLFLKNFENVFFLNKLLTNYRIAVNESQKLSTLQGFIDIDKQIRNAILVVYPKLKGLIELSFPIIELKQIKGHCEVSEEFKKLNQHKIIEMEKSVRVENKIAYIMVLLFKKFLGYKGFF